MQISFARRITAIVGLSHARQFSGGLADPAHGATTLLVRFESFLSGTLEDLSGCGLLRDPDDGAGRIEVSRAADRLGLQALDASSNDYLGLAAHAVSRETLAGASLGAGASRLIHGTTTEHLKLETLLAGWVELEAALLFSSTYAANLGLISALGVAGSLIVSDTANHASIIDGARLAKATVRIVPHLDLDAVRNAVRSHDPATPCWVITESYFSMDGDGPDLRALRALCDEYRACLIVDEAHALGVFGARGAGRCAELGVRPDILVGALGKAVGSHGGFVAGPRDLRTFLWNRARSFVFSTAPSPHHSALTQRQVELLKDADQQRAVLAVSCERLRSKLRAAGLQVVSGSFGPIIAVVVGGNERAVQVATRLRSAGILVQAIRPPTVPAGSARLRLTVKATFSEQDIERLAREVEVACRAS